MTIRLEWGGKLASICFSESATREIKPFLGLHGEIGIPR